MFPDRPQGFNWRGILPGDISADVWTKTLPFDRAPALVNPASGYVINANNTPWVAAGPGDELDAAAFSPLLGIEDDMTNRARSEEHTSELQSLMRISYAVFCLKKKNKTQKQN